MIDTSAPWTGGGGLFLVSSVIVCHLAGRAGRIISWQLLTKHS